MFEKDIYLAALRGAGEELAALFATSRPGGAETIIGDALFGLLPVGDADKRQGVPLESVDSSQLGGGEGGRIDIVAAGHGIEFKTVRLPRLEASVAQALYDLGPLSLDYARLENAGKLTSGELLILLHGPLAADLAGNVSLLREFHNRLFVDFRTSRKFGQLKKPHDRKWREQQIEVIKSMGLDQPFLKDATKMKLYRLEFDSPLALVSIPVL